MKKYLIPSIGVFVFSAFVVYATVQTKQAGLEVLDQNNATLEQLPAVSPNNLEIKAEVPTKTNTPIKTTKKSIPKTTETTVIPTIIKPEIIIEPLPEPIIKQETIEINNPNIKYEDDYDDFENEKDD